MGENGTITNPNNSSETTNEATIQLNSLQLSESLIKHSETSDDDDYDDDDDDYDDDDYDDEEKCNEICEMLMEKGNLAFKESDFSEATDFYARALLIKVEYYGALSPECLKSYYNYGRALLYKVQKETDPLGSMPKKDAESHQGFLKIESTKNKNIEHESSITSVSSNAEQSASSSQLQGTYNVPSKDEGNEDEDSDTEEPAEPEENGSDFELFVAAKMLVRALDISKHSKETMEMVDILSALAEVPLVYADRLMEKGNLALKESDFLEAAESFRRALGIRIRHYGELAPECIISYYKFGIALLYKAQEDADPLGSTPKKDAESQQGSEGNEEEGDESALDLAWKMLCLARAISEKHSKVTLDMFHILDALVQVSLERGDFVAALGYLEEAFSIMKQCYCRWKSGCNPQHRCGHSKL